MAVTAPRTGYAPVNGLEMYYEIHGPATARPLVLLHGAFSATGTSFGAVLPALAETHQVISIEQQAHGHTADIDRPLSIPQMAKDTGALLDQLGVKEADVLGYSMGAGVAFELAIQRPDLVRKLVVVSLTWNKSGFHPGLMEGMGDMKPEQMAGSPWHEEYLRTAPRPADFPRLFDKVMEMNRNIPDWPAEAVASIKAPTLIVIGDADIVRPEHAVEMLRLRGGGVVGDWVGIPASQLAILPGTAYSTIMGRADFLLPVIGTFLDTAAPGA
ncbi:MAG: alpha/beta hydrolase [Chloroflexota bacterium]|nr:alpha/beta hydrolase [Chloroflexota bacterium]